MNEQEKRVEEAAEIHAIRSVGSTNASSYNPAFVSAIKIRANRSFKAGAHWQQSDLAFIADIVRQTLEYVALVEKDVRLLDMHPEIVNNIIKKK